jgi:phage gpG-like protein
MLKGYVIGGEQVVAKFQVMPQEFHAALKKGITRAVIMVQKLSKQKLNGEVLNVRSGRLRRSINTRVTEAASKVEGIVGTNVEYAHVHEFGFHGMVTVREHIRRAKSGKESMVRSQSRKMDVPEKSFLRSALKELEPEIQGEIEGAINTYLKAS